MINPGSALTTSQVSEYSVYIDWPNLALYLHTHFATPESICRPIYDQFSWSFSPQSLSDHQYPPPFPATIDVLYGFRGSTLSEPFTT